MLPAWNNVSHTSAQLLHVACSSWNQVDMALMNGLPCRFAHNALRKKRRVRLFRDDNLDLAFLSQDVDTDILRMTFKQEVYFSVSNLEISDFDAFQERRQHRL